MEVVEFVMFFKRQQFLLVDLLEAIAHRFKDLKGDYRNIHNILNNITTKTKRYFYRV